MVEKELYIKSVFVRQLAFVLGAPGVIELNARQLNATYLIDRAICAAIMSQGDCGMTMVGIFVHLGNVKEKERVLVERINLLYMKGLLAHEWRHGFKRFFISSQMTKLVENIKYDYPRKERIDELRFPDWLVSRVQTANGFVSSNAH